MHYPLKAKLEMGIKKPLVAIIPITESLVVLHATIFLSFDCTAKYLHHLIIIGITYVL